MTRAQLIKSMLENVSSDSQHLHQKPGTVAHACNPGSGEAEMRGLLGWAHWPVSLAGWVSSRVIKKHYLKY